MAPYLSEGFSGEAGSEKNCSSLFAVKKTVPRTGVGKHSPVSFTFRWTQRRDNILCRRGGSRSARQGPRCRSRRRSLNSIKHRERRTSYTYKKLATSKGRGAGEGIGGSHVYLPFHEWDVLPFEHVQ
jgi:hypothetical protein